MLTRCRSVKALTLHAEDGRPAVVLVLGLMLPGGRVVESAYIEMPPGMARGVADDLLRAAEDVDKTRQT